jgi:hypothetical protein
MEDRTDHAGEILSSWVIIRGMRWIAAVATVALLAGCFESQLRYCENGAICPETLACTERTPTVCGEPDQVEACKTMPDRTACSAETQALGTCASGVCGPCVPEYVECRYAEWKPMQSPTDAQLRSLWVVADNNVYAAGAGGTVIHYDGTAWSTVMPQPPTTDVLVGIWARESGELLVVGANGDVHHFAADTWTKVSPTPLAPLFGIWGTDANDAYVVGDSGNIFSWTGAAWAPMTSNTALPLRSVWGTSTSNIVAVGSGGVIQRYNGSNWGAAPSTPLTGLTLRGVWTSDTKIIAVGNQSTMGGIIATKEAAAWNTQLVSTMYLSSVWGRADDDVYAVGTSGTIMHYDGSTWTAMASGAMSDLEAVGGTQANTFAVGAAGTILRLSP